MWQCSVLEGIDIALDRSHWDLTAAKERRAKERSGNERRDKIRRGMKKEREERRGEERAQIRDLGEVKCRMISPL